MSEIPGDTGTAEDAALTRAARSGDVSALALLLERHRPAIRAVALSLLGPGPDVDDVMQEAALVALRRIVDVRDPEAVGPWLRMVVRNSCCGPPGASSPWRRFRCRLPAAEADAVCHHAAITCTRTHPAGLPLSANPLVNTVGTTGFEPATP
ncbi:sigma-70 family RNA polymerase sigma factor [Streptomyces sp. NPDC051917]|uniref:RNA polymerase sigma factor n=1 Tax=Streptomyces sp. NPDC051917 TaxID=3154754 RepID=UPI00345406A1